MDAFPFLRRLTVAGVLTLVATPAFGQSILKNLEKQLGGVLGKEALPPPTQPPVAEEQGYLGLVGDDTNEAGRGVRVTSLRLGTPADAAGLKAGDLIVAINGRAVTSLADLERSLTGEKVGAKLDFKVERAGKLETVPVSLGRRGDAVVADGPAPGATVVEERSIIVSGNGPASLGVTVLPVTDEARTRYGLAVRQGALISAIRQGSPADVAGLPIGGVIVAAEGRRVDRPDDLIELIRSMKPGEEIMVSYYQGTTLFRKTARLAEAPAEAAIRVPGIGGGPVVEGDRPVLRRLERALEGVAIPGLGPVAPANPSAPAFPAEVPLDWKREVETLRARIDELERRLAELEQRAVAKPRAPLVEAPLVEEPLELPPPKPMPPK